MYWNQDQIAHAWAISQQKYIPYVSYSQVAYKAVYKQEYEKNRHRQEQQHHFHTVFPPLPSGPPPRRPLNPPIPPQVLPIPTGLLENTASSLKSVKLSSQEGNGYSSYTDYDSTVLKHFMDWMEGRTQCLLPFVASEFGLDLWLYKLRNKPHPTKEQELLLQNRVLELAQKSPYHLHECIQNKTFKDLLGPGFEWVECPKDW